ncbi:MAG: hypothetical protein MMC33_010274, partial [Icmadophila ericetorum]|nr:hypothetical protein [Icmadophila ericetorum]
MYELAVVQAIKGNRGGGLTSVVAVLVSDIVSLRERGTWQGVINIISGTGTGVDAGEYLGRQQSGGA